MDFLLSPALTTDFNEVFKAGNAALVSFYLSQETEILNSHLLLTPTRYELDQEKCPPGLVTWLKLQAA